MKSTVSLALFATLASANVVRRQNSNVVDLGRLDSAPSPSVTGPPVAAITQNIVAPDAQASAFGSAAASAVATAPSKNKRDPNLLGLWGQFFGQGSTSSASSATTCATSAYTPYYAAVATGGVTGYVTGSPTGTAATACPTTPEDGTYCGFINPLDDCAPQPDGYGPVPTPDTVAAFLAYPAFHSAAKSAKTPAGYTQAFVDQNGQVSGPNYIALKTLQTYNPQDCAAYCDCTSTCSAFNVFVERDPSLNPADSCPNPPSMTSYKCTLWAGPISVNDTTNTGQYRDGFQVAVTGSNGYNKAPSSGYTPNKCSGWQTPKQCPGGAISAPSKLMNGTFFPGPFDPRVCTAYADAQTSLNKQGKKWGQRYSACNVMNAFAVKKDGKFSGMYCNLYTDHPGYWDGPESGSYVGASSGAHQYDIVWSWEYVKPLTSWDFGVFFG